MLYDAWLRTVQLHRNEIALVEGARKWTFGQLAAEADKKLDLPRIGFPKGVSGKFVIEVLQGWRNGQIICPQDTAHTSAVISETSAEFPKDCVHLKFSSGSTGTAQLIAFNAAQLQADAENIMSTMSRPRSEWPNLGVISLAHSYGFSNLVLPLLLHGIPLIINASHLPEALRTACKDFSAITLPAVPALWKIWKDANVITPKIKLAISAGAPLPLVLEKAVYDQTGVKIHNFYGASECGGICFDRSLKPRENNEDVGAPLDSVKVDATDDSCLRVTSEAVGLSYWPQAQATLAHGTFQTSDRAEIKNGRVVLLGRHTDLINISGHKVSPESIEQAILKHPQVRECVVFGVPAQDSSRSETIAACVASDSAVEAEELKQFLLQTIPSSQVPRQWRFFPSLSDADRGKISRSQWKQRFLSEL